MENRVFGGKSTRFCQF